jgi:hypothetical protein
MRIQTDLKSKLFLLIAFSFLFCLSCETKTTPVINNENAGKLVGSWTLVSKIDDDKETPVTQRFLKLEFRPDGSFKAAFRGDENQAWIRPGQGGYAYNPPILTLYWQTGNSLSLLVSELGPDKLRIHHGRNMAPLKDQEPDEVFVRAKPDKTEQK